MFQDEGASTAMTGSPVDSKADMTDGKGSRTSPEKEKPKMASTTWSVSLRAEGKSSVNGMLRLWSWVLRRWMGVRIASYSLRNNVVH